MAKRKAPAAISESDIFQDPDISNLIDPEEIINIDMDDLEGKAKAEAAEMVENLTKLYHNERFMKEQPNFKRRVETELESLRINLKMRKADEVAHDILVKNIGQNPSNASLYMALTKMQTTIISVTTKIEDTITRINNLMKSYQLEINFDQEVEETEQPSAQPQKSFKGARAFVESMGSAEDDDIEVPVIP